MRERRQLIEETFSLVYHVPGLSRADVMNMSPYEEQEWIKLLINQKKMEEQKMKSVKKS